MKHILITLLFASATICRAQQIEIGKAVDNNIIITIDTLVIQKAMQRTLGDGTAISRLHIESVAAHHYLIGEGVLRGINKYMGVALTYNINTRTYFTEKDGGAYVTCTSAACVNCSMFKENGKIIGCKCAEKSTISNQCNFYQQATSNFYDNIIRAKQFIKQPQKNK